MKTKIWVTVIALFITTVVWASGQYFNQSGAEVGHFGIINCGSNVLCTQSAGTLNIAVGALVTGSATTLTKAQCGSTIVGPGSAVVLTLPEASTVLGCVYRFVCGTTSDMDANPADATDVISITGSITGANTTTVLAPSAGDAIRCTDVGAGFVLQAVANDLWAVMSTNGIITDVN